MLYDIGALRWDPWLCELFETPIHAVPEVRESSGAFGETTFEGILLRLSVPIRGVMGDSQASLLAQRCLEPGMTKVTFGTGSSVLMNIGGELRHPKSGAVSTIAWVHRGAATYALEGIVNYSAATIAWLRDQLGLIASAQEAGALASAVPDNGGVYLVPAFAGLSAPYWNPDARAAIVGLTAHSTRNHIVRAAEESIAYQLRDIMEMMKADAGVPLRRIHADGGPTRDAFLMSFIRRGHAPGRGTCKWRNCRTARRCRRWVHHGCVTLGQGVLADLAALAEAAARSKGVSAQPMERGVGGTQIMRLSWKRAANANADCNDAINRSSKVENEIYEQLHDTDLGAVFKDAFSFGG